MSKNIITTLIEEANSKTSWTQNRSQNLLWGGYGIPKTGPFRPNPLQKNPFLIHFVVAKMRTFWLIAGVVRRNWPCWISNTKNKNNNKAQKKKKKNPSKKYISDLASLSIETYLLKIGKTLSHYDGLWWMAKMNANGCSSGMFTCLWRNFGEHGEETHKTFAGYKISNTIQWELPNSHYMRALLLQQLCNLLYPKS